MSVRLYGVTNKMVIFIGTSVRASNLTSTIIIPKQPFSSMLIYTLLFKYGSMVTRDRIVLLNVVAMCWSQWPRGLRYEMSSPAWTLGSWVRISLEAWMFVCVYSVFVFSCEVSGLAMGWSLVQGVLPTLFKCKIMEPHEGEAKARYALQSHIRRRKRT
jgi:hypothetical protein